MKERKVKDMKRAVVSLIHALDHLADWTGKILAPVVLVMIFTVMYEVISRYFFNRPTIWSLQLSTMIFGSYMVIGGAYSVYAKNYVNMDLFYAKWSERTRALMDVITFPLLMFFLYVLLWKSMSYGLESVYFREHSTEPWGQPLYHWKMTAPLGVFLLILQNLNDFLRNLVLLITGERVK